MTDDGLDEIEMAHRVRVRAEVAADALRAAEPGPPHMSPKSYVISMSGGKDSTAMALHLLRERELDGHVRLVTFDTGWEHPDTYAYLRYLEDVLGMPIESRVRYPKKWADELEAQATEIEAVLDLDNDGTARKSAMVRWTLSRGMFPSRVRKFCTQELKIFNARDVMREEHETGRLPVNCIGIRAAESKARSELEEFELSPQMDAMVWRPLIRWTERDVIDCHSRHSVQPNPLYLRGANRVGCWPCIQAGKTELRMLATDGRRIRAMELLERHVGDSAAVRHVRDEKETPFNRPGFFQMTAKNEDDIRQCAPIREHIEWSQTTHGGRQMDMLAMIPDENGCMRWGLCDTASGA
jgi:3'-phosphoadenosine 5'-phosphosulfate sulfotransferase (PAPS reductase)/FAD synthetase